MSAKPRAWYQFHLSTAFLMMLVASGLLWANIAPYELVRLRPMEFPSITEMVTGWPLNRESWGDGVNLFVCICVVCLCGFLFECAADSDLRRRCRLDPRTRWMLAGMLIQLAIANLRAYTFDGHVSPAGFAYGWPLCCFSTLSEKEWFARPLIVNAIAAAMILAITAAVCEALVRWTTLRPGQTVSASFQPLWMLTITALVFCLEPPRISPLSSNRIPHLMKVHATLIRGITRELKKGYAEDAAEMFPEVVSLGLSRIPECGNAEAELKALLERTLKKPVSEHNAVEQLLITEHARLMKEAMASLDKGDIVDAQVKYRLAVCFRPSTISESSALEDEFNVKLKKLQDKP